MTILIRRSLPFVREFLSTLFLLCGTVQRKFDFTAKIICQIIDGLLLLQIEPFGTFSFFLVRVNNSSTFDYCCISVFEGPIQDLSKKHVNVINPSLVKYATGIIEKGLSCRNLEILETISK